jgi:hypothetical protein
VRWQIKALTQKAIDVLPQSGTERANHFLQRRVAHSLPVHDAELLVHFDQAVAHLRSLESWTAAARDPAHARVFEFGAGWDLIGPLSMFALGVGSQLVVDVRPLVRWSLVNDAIARLDARHAELSERVGRPLRRLGLPTISSPDELADRYGIIYRAPCDARDTGLSAGSFDLITNTFTLEHIPPQEVGEIFRECNRLLSSTGAMRCAIDMHDHYSYVDPQISAYNFLRFGDFAWRLLSSSLNYQNRLRARDYLRLAEAAGLRILEQTATPPTMEHQRMLAALPLASRFQRDYELPELAATVLALVAARGS